MLLKMVKNRMRASTASRVLIVLQNGPLMADCSYGSFERAGGGVNA